MPAVSTKVEVLTSLEAQDPMKVALNLILKKTRNLEKRKGKLDELRKKATTGSVLEKDQADAIGHYKEVTANLEFARELSKHFTQINNDAEKLQRKQAKRDKFERQMQDQKLVFEVLQLQCLLDVMGTDSVRNDYLSGNRGAVVLTQENLDQLDELVQVVTPEQNGGMKSHLAQLQLAAEHIVNLLEGKDKAAFGTNYKVMKELLDRMNGCGYFENMTGDGENEEGVAKMDDKEEQEVVTNDSGVIPVEISQDAVEHQYDYEQEETMEPVSDSAADQVSLRLQMENLTTNSLPVQTADISSTSASQQAPDSTAPITGNYDAADDERQSTDARTDAFYQPSRQFQEIVSSVQGSFNFLQESTIEMETAAAAAAAAAAHMESSSHIHPAGHTGAGGDSAVLTGFTQGNLHTDKPTSALTGQSAHLPSKQDFNIGSFSTTSVGSSSVVSPGSGDSLQQQQQAQSVQKHQHSNIDNRMKDSSSFVSSESYSQSIHSQNLSNVSTYSVDDKATSLSQQQQSQSVSSVLSQSSSVPSTSDPSISSFDPPPPIPLPNQAQQLTEDGSHSQRDSDKKAFGTHLNANAAVFNPSSQPSSTNDTFSSNTHSSQNASSDSDYQSGSTGAGYQGGNFRGSTYTRGGNRGNNYRGGRGGMQNMYGRNSGAPRGGFNDRGGRSGGQSGGGYVNGRGGGGGGSKSMRGSGGGSSGGGSSGGGSSGGGSSGMQRGGGAPRGGFGRPAQ